MGKKKETKLDETINTDTLGYAVHNINVSNNKIILDTSVKECPKLENIVIKLPGDTSVTLKELLDSQMELLKMKIAKAHDEAFQEAITVSDRKPCHDRYLEYSVENDGKCNMLYLPLPEEGKAWGIGIPTTDYTNRFLIYRRRADINRSEFINLKDLLNVYEYYQNNTQYMDTDNVETVKYIMKYVNKSSDNEARMSRLLGRSGLNLIKNMAECIDNNTKRLSNPFFNYPGKPVVDPLVKRNEELEAKLFRAKLILNRIYGDKNHLINATVDENVPLGEFYNFVDSRLFEKATTEFLKEKIRKSR